MIDSKKLIHILNKIYEKIDKNKQYLTDLDAAIGDGDHGLNMAKGFKAVYEKLDTYQSNDIGDILRTVGMVLVSTVGGASGPLYGTAFMKASMIVKGKCEMDIFDFLNLLKAALDGIKYRGKGTEGEKTMIDAVSPAITALEEGISSGLSSKEVLQNSLNAAKAGVEYTKTIKATKGRASYLGERSIGHQDPGATSFYYIFETIVEEM